MLCSWKVLSFIKINHGCCVWMSDSSHKHIYIHVTAEDDYSNFPRNSNKTSFGLSCASPVVSTILSQFSMNDILFISVNSRIGGRVKETQTVRQTTLRVRRRLRAQKELLLEKGSMRVLAKRHCLSGHSMPTMTSPLAPYALPLHRPKAWRDPESSAKHCWSNQQSISHSLWHCKLIWFCIFM